MNLPNKLTIFRMILVPFYLFFLLMDSIPFHEMIALGIFIVAALTDQMDGHIARKYNLVTTFGKFMDPLADKFLVIAALVGMVGLGKVSSVACFIIVARELAVTGLRVLNAEKGIVVAANKGGKIKTITQIIAIILLSLNNFPFSYLHIPMDQIMLWISVVLTVTSGYSYFKGSKGVLLEGLK